MWQWWLWQCSTAQLCPVYCEQMIWCSIIVDSYHAGEHPFFEMYFFQRVFHIRKGIPDGELATFVEFRSNLHFYSLHLDSPRSSRLVQHYLQTLYKAQLDRVPVQYQKIYLDLGFWYWVFVQLNQYSQILRRQCCLFPTVTQVGSAEIYTAQCSHPNSTSSMPFRYMHIY